MYKQFYGLRDIPFSLAPDPKYLFRTDSLLEVFATLQYGVESGKGLVVVTGEVGTGKTTILRSMLQSLDRSILAAYIFNPLLSSKDFFDLLATEFRIPPQQSKAAMLRRLGELLVTRHKRGLSTVLVIDEAHLLPPHLLEEIRLLSNFETTREKLLQIILCGQPELHASLAQPEQRQLKQRISLKCAIKTLAQRETAEYIRWRLRVAGAQNENLFEAEAVRQVHQLSGGIPRIINNICDNALLTGFSEESRIITPQIIREVADDLDLTPVDYALYPTAAEIATGLNIGEQDVEAAFERFAQNPEAGAPTNVRYIRETESSATGRAGWDAGKPATVETDPLDGDDWDAPLKFFKRARLR
jgi:type II secretory pathway predicted ATPase ExeA